MPKDGEIDGFTAFRAAQKANAAPGGEGPRVRAAAEGRTKRGEAPGSRIGRTAMPSGKAIVCYYCDHEFEIVGAQANTMCGNCKEWLDVKDITVNRANWSQDLTTAGSLLINSMGVVAGGKVLANKVILKGKIEGGEIYATHQLIVHKNALLNLDNVTARDLVIAKGAEFEVEEGLLDRFHNIEVHGALAGTVRPTGKFIIHPSGYFTGMIEAGAIQVLDGGILEASCKMTGQIREPAIRSKPKVPKRSKTSNTPAAKAAMAARSKITADNAKKAAKESDPTDTPTSTATKPTEKKPTASTAAAAAKSPAKSLAKIPTKTAAKSPTKSEAKPTVKASASKPAEPEVKTAKTETVEKAAKPKPAAKKTPAKELVVKKPTKADPPKPKPKELVVKAPTKADPPDEKPKPKQKPKELVVKKPSPKPKPATPAKKPSPAIPTQPTKPSPAKKKTVAKKPTKPTKPTKPKRPTKPTKPTKPSSSTSAKKKTRAKKPSSSAGTKKKTTAKKPSAKKSDDQ